MALNVALGVASNELTPLSLAFASEGDKKGYINTTGKFVFELPK